MTVKEIFQDVPADHAFKTMTMEAFPHSGTQLASVHPCKHASVMKKFIDRMEESTAEVPPPGKDGRDGKDKRRWLPGVMRKVTGSDKKGASGGSTPHGDEEAGVQVDFYLVIVSAPSSGSCEAGRCRLQGCEARGWKLSGRSTLWPSGRRQAIKPHGCWAARLRGRSVLGYTVAFSLR